MRFNKGEHIIINNPCDSIIHKKNARIYAIYGQYCQVKFEKELDDGLMKFITACIPHYNIIKEDLYYET